MNIRWRPINIHGKVSRPLLLGLLIFVFVMGWFLGLGNAHANMPATDSTLPNRKMLEDDTINYIIRTERLPNLIEWGEGVYSYFGFRVYTAKLWATDNPTTVPLILRLTYARALKGADIARASREEMTKFVADPALLIEAEAIMQKIFPDVKTGESIIGVWLPDKALFYQGEKRLGELPNGMLARAFFNIWLDSHTSAPKLRQSLLKPPNRPLWR